MNEINLLSAEHGERLAARRRRFVYGLVALVYVGLLAFGYLAFQGRANAANTRLAIQVADNERIRADIVSLAPAARLRDTYAAKVQDVSEILASDIAWGRFLNDLARVVPDRIWVTSFQASASVSVDNPGSVGQVSLSGVGFDYPDVAAWLRTLDSDRWPAIGAAWVLGTTAEAGADAVDSVTFSSVGSLTEMSLSSRARERIPEVAR